jgi:hypothetical protein
MRRALFGLALALAGCRDVRPPESVVEAPQPLAPLESQRARLEAMRAVPPDARFVSAVAAMHHFVTGWTIVAPDLERTPKGTRIRYYGIEVGVLPERASFSDAIALLAAWAPKMGKPWKLPEAAATTQGELLFDEDAIDTLSRLQLDWEKAPSRRGVHDAMRALVGLVLGQCDELGLADDLEGRALAATVLDRLHGSVVDRELALLADHFGYPADAAKLAEKLPESDAVSAFVRGDDALSHAQGTLGRFLDMTRRARHGDFDGARSLAVSSLSVRLCGGDDKVASALFSRALLDAALSAEVTVASKAKADLDALRTADTTRVTAIVYGWLALQKVDGFPRFEIEVERAGAHDRGPFLDRSTRQTLLRARAANALRHVSLALVRQKKPEEAVRAFGDEVPLTSSSDLGRSLRAHFLALVDARKGVSVAAPTGALGPLATVDVVETMLSRLEHEVPEDEWDARGPAKWALPRLDARRAHRVLVTHLAKHALFDHTLEASARSDAEALASANGPRLPTLGIERPDPLSLAKLGEPAARDLEAPAIESATAIAAIVANDDPKGAATAIATIGSVRPRVIAATLGRALDEVVVDHEKAKALDRAMAEASIPWETRRAIALGARTRWVLAAAILPKLVEEAKGPLARVGLASEAAFAIGKAHGEEAARGFRAAHPVGEAAPFAAPILYAHGAPISLEGGPPDVADLSTLLSIATPEALRDPAKVAAARSRLDHPKTRFAGLARHLVGLDDLSSVLSRSTSAAERCELAYYLGIAALARGKPEEADVWFLTALDEGGPDVAEWRFAIARENKP